jgi:hypothetical protein
MNGQYFGERFDTSDAVEGTHKDMNEPVINSDPFAYKAPADATEINELPVDGAIDEVNSMNEPFADRVMIDTPEIHETPMVGTIAPVGPIDEAISYRAPMNENVPYKAPMIETTTHEAPIATIAATSATLLGREESEHFRTRWNEIQGQFVDEPRSAVQQADILVTEVVEQITQMFAKEHSSLEGQWKQGNDVSTEDLRKALQHYRSFFNRLVL